jgi:hypothetical protein
LRYPIRPPKIRPEEDDLWLCPEHLQGLSVRTIFLTVLLLVCTAATAQELPSKKDEDAVRTLIARWYEELAKKDAGRVYGLVSPGFIDASPHVRHLDTGAASLGARIYESLAAEALKFTFDIGRLRIDPNFAKVDVWERGYFYAFAAQKTYERAAHTVFILERREGDGQWLILAHQSSSQGIPPNKITNPMPDLRALFYATTGKDRDPDADAKNAGNF